MVSKESVKKKSESKTTKKPAAKKSDTKKAENKKQDERKVAKDSKKITTEIPKLTAEKEKIEFPVQAKAIIMFLAAAILFILVLYPGENVWTMTHNCVKGIFGCLGIMLPILLVYLGVITAMEKQLNGKAVNNLFLGSVAVVLISTCVFLFGSNDKVTDVDYFNCLGMLFQNGMKDFSNGSAAGLFGGILGYPLAFLFGKVIAEILCVLLLLVDIMFLFSITAKDVVQFVHKPVMAVKQGIKQVALQRTEKVAAKPALLSNGSDVCDDEDDIDDYIDLSSMSEKVAAIKSAKNVGKKQSYSDYNDNYQESIQSDGLSTGKHRNKLLEAARQMNGSAEKQPENEQTNDSEKKLSILDKLSKPKQEDERPTKKSELAQAEEEISKQISENTDDGEQGSYNYPPIELLHPSSSKEDTRRAMEELERNGNKLESTLKSFGVNANIINICRGPSVTRFEVQPAPGVKISKITNLSDDIALNLAASGVRIEAPIPGKAAVGIEVPNKVVTMVSMRELIDSRQFTGAKSKLSVVLGKDISGNTIVTDLAKMPHLLIAGTTGSGKSVCVNSILISLLYKATPDEVKLLLIDPKMVEFSKYKGIPHLLIPVVIDPKKAAGALNWAVNEMENRYKTFSAYGVRDIGGYNAMIDSYNQIRATRTQEELEAEPIVNSEGIPIPDKKMSSIVIAIDEFADLMMTAPTEVEDSICRLAQKARAAGMHLVVATQRPTVNVITGVIKANIPSRISLKVSSQLDSRTILDVGGAEKLIGRGDMLFAPIGSAKPMRVQGCYASDAEIENVTSYVKKDHATQYNMEVQEEIEKITQQELTKGKDSDNGGSGGVSSDDEMMEEAIKLVVENGQASTSLLQRRLRLGYARAGRLIDEMEQMGIVGPHVGSKSREVLMTYQQWLERKNNLSE